MKAFLKDNIALVAAIALPALLAVIFGISTLFIKASVEDPRNDFLIVTDYNSGGSGALAFDVVNDRLQVTQRPVEKDSNGNPIRYGNEARLWRVHVPEMSVEEISIQKAGDAGGNIDVPATANLTVRNITPGPDGYSYEDSYRGYGGNLMTEIFAGGSRSYESSVGISKGGRYVIIHMPDNQYSYYNTRFIGWIIEE